MRKLKHQLWPHKVTIKNQNPDEWNDMELWLGEQMGVFKGRWNAVYNFSHTDYYFRNGSDATLFILRWG